MVFSFSRAGQVAAMAMAGVIAFAGEPSKGFDVRMSIRGGAQIGDLKDGLERQTIGGGLDLGYNTGFGRFGAELGYQYKPGAQYLKPASQMEKAPGVVVDPKQSVDSRKPTLEGLSLRLGYENQIGGTDLFYRVGVQFANAKYRLEVIGLATDMENYFETFNGTPTKSAVLPSVFAGLSYKVNAFSTVDVGIHMLSYKAIDYVHVANGKVLVENDTSKDYTRETKRTVPHIEFGYTFRF